MKGSHAYQARSDALRNGDWHGGWPQGIWNFITASGDNVGDQQEVLRGIRYHREVFEADSSNVSSLSCEDQESIENGGSGNTGGGPGGTDSGGGSGAGRNDGYITYDSGEEWCFVQAGKPTYCWIE